MTRYGEVSDRIDAIVELMAIHELKTAHLQRAQEYLAEQYLTNFGKISTRAIWVGRDMLFSRIGDFEKALCRLAEQGIAEYNLMDCTWSLTQRGNQ